MSVLDMLSLKGKVALLTGGAGLYGRQICAALAEAGAETYIASRNVDALQVIARAHQDLGRNVTALQFDQGEEQSILRLRDTLLERAGHVDILVNNAVIRPMKKGYQDTAEAFGQSMLVNATGLFVITRAFGDAMADAGNGGSIINVGSIQGLIGPDPTIYRETTMHGWFPDYFFHKGGMVNFTRFIGSYYGKRNIRCNCIAPGGFWTENMPDAFVRQYSERTFLGRLANGTDLKGIIVFLASDASSYITGATIPVDGGYTAK